MFRKNSKSKKLLALLASHAARMERMMADITVITVEVQNQLEEINKSSAAQSTALAGLEGEISDLKTGVEGLASSVDDLAKRLSNA